MAGTVPISMTQQFTSQGVPLVGGKLYVFQTATTTPQSAYQDSGLTTALPNPLTLDSSGRVPPFFLADGTIKVRLTDSAGVIQAEWDNLLVIGPSSGSGGGGSTVDPTTVFQTGDVIWLDQSGVRSGWVRDNGRTIGSATSGASERANADTSALFSFIWNTYPDSKCPVSGGRGVSAAADFAANKTIQLPDKRGRTPVGLTDMGNSASTILAGALFSGADTAITVGGLGGEATHILSTGEMPVHTHTDAGHIHGSDDAYRITGFDGGQVPSTALNYNYAHTDGNAMHVASGAANIQATGGGGAHNNMHPFVLGTYYRKI